MASSLSKAFIEPVSAAPACFNLNVTSVSPFMVGIWPVHVPEASAACRVRANARIAQESNNCLISSISYLVGQLVGRAVLAGQVAVGLGIVHEPLRLRIESELASRAERDVREVA